MLTLTLGTFLVGSIVASLLWATLLLAFLKTMKRTKQPRPISTAFTFFNPTRLKSSKIYEGLIQSSELSDLNIKISSYSNISCHTFIPIAPLPIQEHSEFVTHDTEPQLFLFSDQEIQASVSDAQQNLADIIAKRNVRKAELYEFEQLLEDLESSE